MWPCLGRSSHRSAHAHPHLPADLPWGRVPPHIRSSSTCPQRPPAHPHPPCPLPLQAGALPNAKGAHGNTALHQAAAVGHTACIRALLDSKASVDVHAADGCTPLHRAAANGAYRLGPEGTAWRSAWFVAPSLQPPACKPHSVCRVGCTPPPKQLDPVAAHPPSSSQDTGRRAPRCWQAVPLLTQSLPSE